VTGAEDVALSNVANAADNRDVTWDLTPAVAPADVITTTPLIHLRDVGRAYASGANGENTVHALRGVDLQIQSGEMLAIMGASGSGKSTLMNLLGCLDVPTSGSYELAGQEVASLGADELAALRRERFGFVFQRYHLLAHQDAAANVEMPAIYAGQKGSVRRARAHALLSRLGLSERFDHKPNALSGGQQQRVSIARALMNGGEIVLADEPTGALDSSSGREMMAVLHELHARGHTVIIVTHDAQVAAQAPRVVELSDGRVIRDSGWPTDAQRHVFTPAPAATPGPWAAVRRRVAQFSDALGMAFASLNGHRLRSALSMLGISIGIAAVVSIVALSDAARAMVDSKLRSFLSGRLIVGTGGPAVPPGGTALPFREREVQALQGVAGVKNVAVDRESSPYVRHGNKAGQMSLFGVLPPEVPQRGLLLAEGRMLTALDVQMGTQVAVLDPKSRERLFGATARAVGETILVGPLPFTVVGVLRNGGGALDANDWRDRVFIPVSTYRAKISTRQDLRQLNVYVKDGADADQVQNEAKRVLTVLRGQEDFSFFSLDAEFRKVEEVTLMLKLLLAAIAGISLLVGGVGVMNIMLVAVSERTSEIGIRMAVGARRSDVQLQFLIEAVVLCAAGGLVGVAMSWLAAATLNSAQQSVNVVVSWAALGVAFAMSSAIGVGFGFMPARKASRLSPVQALARE
jgi:macrolide transport system ATP-binding/permease protein